MINKRKPKRTRVEIQNELDQHNRNISWTCRRSGVEGTTLDPKLLVEMFATGRQLQEELKELEPCEKKVPHDG